MNELILLGDFTWLGKIKFGYQNNPSQDTKREYDTFESSLRKKCVHHVACALVEVASLLA